MWDCSSGRGSIKLRSSKYTRAGGQSQIDILVLKIDSNLVSSHQRANCVFPHYTEANCLSADVPLIDVDTTNCLGLKNINCLHFSRRITTTRHLFCVSYVLVTIIDMRYHVVPPARFRGRVLFVSALSAMLVVVGGWPISCNVEENPIHRVEKNATTGELFFAINNSASIKKRESNLRNATLFDRRPPRFEAVESSKMENTTVDRSMDIRECTCGASKEHYYCPVQASICAVAAEDARPTCHSTVSHNVLGIPPQAWLGVWMVLCLSVLGICGQGRILIDFFIGTIYPKYNIFLVHRMLAHSPEQAIAMIRGYMERREQALERHRYRILFHQASIAPLHVAKNPRSLVLKTCRFYDNDREQDSDSDQTDCTICFVSIEKGDRVGKLNCQHLFHVDCLKIWLRKRNVCPLCLTENIATPRYN